MCTCGCACMCACIELWALRQAWLHTSTSSLGFECDPCEIERGRAGAEGLLSLLPYYWLWPEADSLTMSSSVVIVLPPTPHPASPLASSPSQTSSLALLFAPSHCQLAFSSHHHAFLLKPYIGKLADCCRTIVVSGRLALMETRRNGQPQAQFKNICFIVWNVLRICHFEALFLTSTLK